MNCEGCYKNGICFFCVKFFACSKTKEQKLAENCFNCSEEKDCKNTKEA